MNTQSLKQIPIYICMVFILVSCTNKPPEILKIERTESIFYYEKESLNERRYVYSDESGDYIKEQHFIILNHPRNRSELMKLINDFNKETITKDTLLKYNKGFIRTFYKKDRETMEAYEMGKSYTNTDAYDSMEEFERQWRSQISSQLEYCRNAQLVRISWRIDSKQNIDIYYDINDDYIIMDDVSDDELFDLK